MRQTRRLSLERRLELWARWIFNGKTESSGFSSTLEMMMVTRCEFSGDGSVPSYDLEADVEAAVMSLRMTDGSAAKILEVEYGAWVPKSLDGATKQLDKAHALGLSLRTYKRKLAKARKHVADYLGIGV